MEQCFSTARHGDLAKPFWRNSTVFAAYITENTSASHTWSIMRSFFPFAVFLVAPIISTLSADNIYEAFLPSNEPDEPEWSPGAFGTVFNEDMVDVSPLEVPADFLGQGMSVDIASTGDRCSSGGVQLPGVMKRRAGADDYCSGGSNLAPPEKQLVIPNLSTLKLDDFCPKKFPSLASLLVCASIDPTKTTSSLFLGYALEDSQLGES